MNAAVLRSMAISLVLTAAGVAWVVFMVGEPADLLIALELPALAWVFALAAAAAAFALGGVRLSYICRRMQVALAFRHGLRTHLLGMFSAAVTPGGAGHTPAIALMLQHHRVPPKAAWAAAVAVFRADTIFHAWGLPLALVALFGLGLLPRTGTWLAIGAVAIAFTVALAWIMQFKLHWLRPIVGTVLRGPLRRFRESGMRFVDGMLESDRTFAEAPLGWQIVVQALTALSWLAFFTVLWVLAVGLQAPISWLGAIGMQLLVVNVSVLVPTPGGSGFFEIGLSYLLIGEGGGANVPAIVLLWRLITFYSAFVIGPWLGGAVLGEHLKRRRQGANE